MYILSRVLMGMLKDKMVSDMIVHGYAKKNNSKLYDVYV